MIFMLRVDHGREIGAAGLGQARFFVKQIQKSRAFHLDEIYSNHVLRRVITSSL